MAWEKNGTPDTLTGVGDTIEITDLTAKKFNQFFIHQFASGNAVILLRFNNNNNSVYAIRQQDNGGGDATAVSQTEASEVIVVTTPHFAMNDCISIAGEEKLGIAHIIEATSGPGTAPQRREFVYKFVPSPDADIIEINYINNQTGDYDTDSNLSALGTD